MFSSIGTFIWHLFGGGKPLPASLALMVGPVTEADAQDQLLRRAMKAASEPDAAQQSVVDTADASEAIELVLESSIPPIEQALGEADMLDAAVEIVAVADETPEAVPVDMVEMVAVEDFGAPHSTVELESESRIEIEAVSAEISLPADEVSETTGFDEVETLVAADHGAPDLAVELAEDVDIEIENQPAAPVLSEPPAIDDDVHAIEVQEDALIEDVVSEPVPSAPKAKAKTKKAAAKKAPRKKASGKAKPAAKASMQDDLDEGGVLAPIPASFDDAVDSPGL